MALGAGPHAILGLMLWDSTRVVGLGIAAGVVASVFGSRWTRGLLYGLAPDDAATFAAASLLLFAASLVTAFVPAYRAANGDPADALRLE
jgi:ABC-type lipoprotein release transport system permease subunit